MPIGGQAISSCTCVLPNTGADCSKYATACTAGGACQVLSETLEAFLTTGVETRFFEDEKQEDGSSVLRAKPNSWFGDETVHSESCRTPAPTASMQKSKLENAVSIVYFQYCLVQIFAHWHIDILVR